MQLVPRTTAPPWSTITTFIGDVSSAWALVLMGHDIPIKKAFDTSDQIGCVSLFLGSGGSC